MTLPPLIAAALLALAPGVACAQVGPASGKPLPRFESVAAAEAFGRNGPGFDHRIDWLYQRPGLPVEVIEEAKEWRRIKDPAGDVVWMHASRLGGLRTVMVIGAQAEGAALTGAPRAGSPTVARLQNGVIGVLGGCIGPWREVTVAAADRRSLTGWIAASALWGAPACQTSPSAPARRG